MKCLPALCSTVAAALLLASCGQKGPLVLPDAPKPKRTMPTVPGLRRAPEPQQSPVPPPQQAPIDAAPVPQAPVTPATTSPR